MRMRRKCISSGNLYEKRILFSLAASSLLLSGCLYSLVRQAEIQLGKMENLKAKIEVLSLYLLLLAPMASSDIKNGDRGFLEQSSDAGESPKGR